MLGGVDKGEVQRLPLMARILCLANAAASVLAEQGPPLSSPTTVPWWSWFSCP